MVMARKKNSLVRASVIIPAYNAEKTLQSCLDALMQQTHIPDEIIVVDDGSVDGTKTIADAYSLVTVISQKNKGPAKARNAGAAAAKSDIIIFLDSDCVPEKNWLEEMLNPFADEKVAGVQGAYKTRQPSLVARFDQADIEYRYERMKRAKKLDWIGSYSAAYRRKIFLAEKGFDETFPKASGEDAELSYRMSEKGYKLVFAPRAIVFHTHPQTLLHYLRVKFFRAYWRTRMYLKHPQKSVRDSYTPYGLKLNFFVGGAFLALLGYAFLRLLFSPWSKALLVDELRVIAFGLVLILFVIVFTLLDFVIQLMRKDVRIVPMGLLIIFLRSLVFVAGAFFGLIDPRVRA